jgi:hypothetical protein
VQEFEKQVAKEREIQEAEMKKLEKLVGER